MVADRWFMKRNVKVVLFCVLTLVFIGCDQVTKEIAKEHLKDQPARSFYHDTFRLDYAENTGAFLSLGADWSSPIVFWVMNVLPLLFLVALFVYALRKTTSHSLVQLLPFLLICSGGLGNIIDRFLYNRHVTDFMNLGFRDFRTGIFNLADVYVSTGVVLMLIFQWKKTSPAVAAGPVQ
jgi:signal peptidase II